MRLRFSLAVLVAALCIPTVAAQPGAFDVTFGADGRVGLIDFAPFRLAVQPDGKILAVGIGAEGPSVRRLTADGAVDPAFGSGGRAVVPTSGNAFLVGAAVQADGHVMVVGAEVDDFTFSYALFAARLTPDGEVDASFGTDGVRRFGTNFAYPSIVVAAAPGGGFVVASSPTGQNGSSIEVARFAADGAVDVGFGDDGMASVLTDQLAFAILSAALVDDAGRIYVTGSTTVDDNAYDLLAVRLDASGAPDADFGTDGAVLTTTPSGFSIGLGAALTPTGQLVVGGYEGFNDVTDGTGLLAVRYTEDGSLDAGFGGGGVVAFRGPAGNATMADVAVASDGSVLVGGLARHHLRVRERRGRRMPHARRRARRRLRRRRLCSRGERAGGVAHGAP